jgi:gamma-D-glutamyl-L-lysine dipeptidyl-peptidase
VVGGTQSKQAEALFSQVMGSAAAGRRQPLADGLAEALGSQGGLAQMLNAKPLQRPGRSRRGCPPRRRHTSERATLLVIRFFPRLLAGTVVPFLLATAPAAGVAAAPEPGSPAWVQVSVATVWIHPNSPRPLDDPALLRPAQVGRWLGSMTVLGRLGLNGRVDTQMVYGRKVVILNRSGHWSRVEIPSQTGNHFPNGVIGWVPSAQLSQVPPPEAARAVVVSVPSTWLYALTNGVVGSRQLLLSYDTELPELSISQGYAFVGLPGGAEGAIAAGAVAPVHTEVVPGSAIVAQARLFLGLPYLWGGTSGFGYDCSGLVYSVFGRFGIILPRDAADQKRAVIPAPLSQARPGDLLFFAGPHGTGEVDHVGIYAGDGLMIDSPYTGAVVEEIPITSSPAWPGFAGAGRARGMG